MICTTYDVNTIINVMQLHGNTLVRNIFQGSMYVPLQWYYNAFVLYFDFLYAWKYTFLEIINFLIN